MNLRAYLEQRTRGNSHLNALTRAEAQIIGLCYPLKRNWAKKHANKKISPIQYEQFLIALVKSRSNRKVSPTKRQTYQSKTYTKPKTIDPELAKVASDDFLQTFEWRKLRMQALKKYGAKCMCCGATPATGAVMNVDHIKPRKLWPSYALDIKNLQILCHECNHGKGNWDSTDWRPKL